MAWYTDTTNAPKVYLEYTPQRPQSVWVSTDLSLAGKTRRITTTKFEFRGLTRAAADSIANTYTDTDTVAVSSRMNEANAYKVTVTQDTTTAWT